MSPAEQALQLRDIHLPPPPPWWPPAPGWWLLAAVTLAALWLLVRVLVRQGRRRRKRRQVTALLADLEGRLLQNPSPESLAGLSDLLKRLALLRFPADEVAALSGDDWLAFLDRSGGEGTFTKGPGRVLADGAYRRNLSNEIDVPGLMVAVRQWVSRNGGGIE